MKLSIQICALVLFVAPAISHANTVSCHGDSAKIVLTTSGDPTTVGTSITAAFADSDPTFKQKASVSCQVEQTVSGTYCVDE